MSVLQKRIFWKFGATILATQPRSISNETADTRRESVWTFPSRWRLRFFIIFYTLVVGSTAWGIYETIVAITPDRLNYRSFIPIYVQSIAGSVVTSMLIIDLLRSITMLSNAIEDWLIERRKQRELKWRAEEEKLRAAVEKRQAEAAKRRAAEEQRRARQDQIRQEAIEYGKLVATCEAQGKDVPPPPWEIHRN